MPTTLERRHSRRRRHERTRQDLISSAMALAAETSFKDVTVEAVTRGASVSRSAFYVYFGDKEELLLGALEDLVSDQQSRLGACWQGDGEPADRLRRGLGGLARLYAQNSVLLSLAAEASTYDEEVRELWSALIERLTEIVARQIREQRAAGSGLGLIDPDRGAEALVLMTERSFQVNLGRGGRDPDELADELADVWVAALYGAGGG